MARNMEIHEVLAVGTAIIPGIVCVGGFGPFYGMFAKGPLPKRLSRKARRKMKEKREPSIQTHSKPRLTRTGLQHSCKARLPGMGTPSEWNGDGRREKDRTFRNAGRKPRYKDHTESIGKTGKVRQHPTA